MGLWLVNVQPFHEPAVLLERQCSGFCLRSWPLKEAGLQPLVKQYKTVTLPVQHLDPVAASAAEQKQGIGKGVQFKLLLNNGSQALNSESEIFITAGNIVVADFAQVNHCAEWT